MKKFIRIASLLLVFCLVIGTFAGCGTEANRAAYSIKSTDSISSGVLADNAGYTLEWDDAYKCIVVTSKTSGTKWSTTPYELYAAGETGASISSPIEVEIINATTKVIEMDRAYSASIDTGNISAERIDNGIKVTYYFDEYQVSVPVCYTLRDDSFAISIDTTEITEGEEYKLLNVSVAPFLCSAEKNVEENYLFVPSGTGALINTMSLDGEERTYSAEVYGVDGSRLYEELPIDEERIKLPVYGAKNGNTALFAIIESGAEMAFVEASSGSKRNDYGNVYATIYTRGFDIYAEELGYNTTVTTRNADLMTDETVVIGYYMLDGEDADYMGMAECYRNYLIKNKNLTVSKEKENAYALSVLGNIRTDKLAFGVPYKTTESLTSFKDTQSIISELAGDTGLYPTVQMVGFGKTGIDVGKIADGFKFSSEAGSKKDYAAIEELAKNNNFLLSVDFDLIGFSKSGNGANTLFDVAKSPTMFRIEQQYIHVALRNFDEDQDSYYLLSRDKVSGMVDKLIKKASKMGVTGVSTSTLGQIAYSDYENFIYASRGKTESEVTEFLNRISDAGYKVVTDNANAYAAVSSDAILNVEVNGHGLNSVAEYIPFYQIVFKGYKPLYSEALNLTTNYQKSVLNALASGTGLGYTLINNYDLDYAATPHKNLYNSLYSDNKDEIIDAVKEYQDYYNAIAGAKITDYNLLENGVTETVYDNGVVAYTNPSDKAVNTPVGEIPAYGFIYK